MIAEIILITITGTITAALVICGLNKNRHTIPATTINTMKKMKHFRFTYKKEGTAEKPRRNITVEAPVKEEAIISFETDYPGFKWLVIEEVN